MSVTDPNQPDNPIIFANGAFLELTGYSTDELYGRNCRLMQGADTDPQAIALIRDAVKAKSEISIELLNYRKDGSSFWNALFVSPVYSEAGELIYYFASQLDVSRRRDAEEALHQSQKMEALGQLTGGIAHDFNNLLQVMGGYIDLADRAVAKPELDTGRVQRNLAMTRHAIDRATTLTQQLLAFSRKQKLEGRVINLNNLMDFAHSTVERPLRRNACRALRLSCDHRQWLRHARGRQDPCDGTVFHHQGGGQGHGPWPVDGVRVCQTVGRDHAAGLCLAEEQTKARVLSGNESILIVEDRTDVAELARMVLEEQGYQTETAGNGADALALLSSGRAFDLLFSDVVMPGGMNGMALARAVRKS
nr:putative LOV domain-containing protein [Tanacetum cinerariifolium]